MRLHVRVLWFEEFAESFTGIGMSLNCGTSVLETDIEVEVISRTKRIEGLHKGFLDCFNAN
jgi:hypothetical protein